jgi:hypothetical protein
MSLSEKKKGEVFNTRLGGTVTIKRYKDYSVLEFTNKKDSQIFLENTTNAKKLTTFAKYVKNQKVLTYKILVK